MDKLTALALDADDSIAQGQRYCDGRSKSGAERLFTKVGPPTTAFDVVFEHGCARVEAGRARSFGALDLEELERPGLLVR